MNHRSVGKARAWVAGIVVVVMVGAAAAGVAAQQASPTRQGDRPSLAGRWFGVGPRAMAVGLALRALDDALTAEQRLKATKMREKAWSRVARAIERRLGL